MDDLLIPNPYKTLGIPKDAPLATIRSAHRKLVLSCHPDKVQEPTAKQAKAEQFHLVQQAYEVLSDDTRRRKYDDKLRLADLRTEVMEERGPIRRHTEYASPRPAPAPVFEMRGGHIYEERVPKGTRAYPDDTIPTRFAERPSVKKYDDMFPEPTARKVSGSGRGQEDKRKAREAELEYDRKSREAAKKAEEASAREQRDRKRAKDRKGDREAKASRRQFSYVDDSPPSDSETDDHRYSSRRPMTPPPKKRYEETRRRDRDEPKRSSKRDDNKYDDLNLKLSGAQEHISRSRDAREADNEPRSRTSRPRASSNPHRAPPPAAPAPPPPPPPPRQSDGRRRSSDRERSDKERSDREKDRRHGRSSRPPSPVRTSSSKKDKKYEIVEPASSRKPAMPSFSSDPKGLKNMTSSPRRDPQRAATYTPSPELKHPGMRRSETLPASQMRREPVPLKSSHLKNSKAPSDISDSDSDDTTDSDETPEVRPRATHRQASSTKYKVSVDDEISSPRTILVEEPEEYEDSSKGRRSFERPSMTPRGSSIRTPPTRGSSFVNQDERPSSRRTESARMPPLNTHSSSRGKKLFGAVSLDDYSSPDDTHRSPRSPKASPLDARGSKDYGRRGSKDVDRDPDPYSYPNSRRPSYQRGESVY